MKRAILSLATIAALSFAFVATAARYGTLSPSATVIDAPPLVCTGYEIVTNWVETARGTNVVADVTSAITTNMVVTTNGIWTATDSIQEPTANRLGYKLVVDTPPVTDTNHYAVATGWALDGTPSRITRQYSIIPVPPAPARRIYKYDLSAACVEYDRLDELMGFIGSDAKVKWFWDAAEILVEDDVFFISATNQVIQSGAIPEAEVKKILDRAYELGQLTEAAK